MGLNLVPTAFRSYIKINTDDGESIQWGGRVRLQQGFSVELATGEDLNKLDGELTMELVENDRKGEAKNKPIGWMSYSKGFKDWMKIDHKASYFMLIRIPRGQFGALLTALSQGRSPSLISLDVDGLDPMGVVAGVSYQKWDNKNSPLLPITSIDFITSMIAGDQLIGGHPHDFLDKRINKVIFCLWVIIVLQLIVMWRGH